MDIRRRSGAGLVVALALLTLAATPVSATGQDPGHQVFRRTSPQDRTSAMTELRSQTRAQTPARVSALATHPTVPLKACADDPEWLCGSVKVPMDRAHPSGRSLSVGFTIFPHTDPGATARDALFVSDGGPGYANTLGRGFRLFMLGALTDERDLVLVDHRGTGTSGAINCPKLQGGVDEIDGLLDAVGACGRQLGRDSDRYGSGDVARDMEAVRRALGYPKISYYAQSYGTVALSAYATRFPHRLRAAVADSGTPVDDARHSWGWGLDVPGSFASAVSLICRRAPACAQAQPDARSALARLARAVRRHPVAGKVSILGEPPERVEVDEHMLLLIASDLFNDGELAAAATALADGDRAPLLRLGAEATAGGPGEPSDPAEDSAGDNAAAFCNDQDFVWDRTDPIPVRRAKYTRALSALGPDAFAPFSRQAWRDFGVPDYCLKWPAPDRFTHAIPRHATVTEVPVLILSGDLDTNVPTATTRELRRTFPRARFLRVAGAQHPAAASSECARTVTEAFIRTGHNGTATCTTPDNGFAAAPDFATTAAATAPADRRAGDGSTQLERRVTTAVVRTVRDAWLRSFRVPGQFGSVSGLRRGTADFDYGTFDDHAVISLRGARYVSDVAVGGQTTWTYETNGLDFTVTVDGPGRDDGTLSAHGVFGYGLPFDDFKVTGSLGGHVVKLTVPAN